MTDEEEAESRPEGYDPVEDLLPGVDASHEPLGASERWETFETVLWGYHLAPVRDDASSALYALESAVRDGRRPTAAEVAAARQALDSARELVETHYAALAAGTSPWADGVGDKVPYGVLRRQLEGAGYTVTRGED